MKTFSEIELSDEKVIKIINNDENKILFLTKSNLGVKVFKKIR